MAAEIETGVSLRAFNTFGVEARAAILEKAADALERDLPQWCALIVREGHRTWGDAIPEVRTANGTKLRGMVEDANKAGKRVARAGWKIEQCRAHAHDSVARTASHQPGRERTNSGRRCSRSSAARRRSRRFRSSPTPPRSTKS